jgi:hypothetical protein
MFEKSRIIIFILKPPCHFVKSNVMIKSYKNQADIGKQDSATCPELSPIKDDLRAHSNRIYESKNEKGRQLFTSGLPCIYSLDTERKKKRYE